VKSIIVAVSENSVIGNNNKLPWSYPEDLRWFKHVTLNKVVIMGRKTFESIGKPLPQRINMVLTKGKKIKGVKCCSSLEEAIDAGDNIGKDIFIIGGATVYRTAINVVDRIYLTRIPGCYDGESTFPLSLLEGWKMVSEPEWENGSDLKFQIYERIDIEDRLDEIFGTIDNLLCAGDFDKVDEILRNVDMSESGDILIGYLSITLAASHNLSSRADFFRKVSEKLDPAELVGLE